MTVVGPTGDGALMLADLPDPPYVAVIFTTVTTPDDAGYGAMADEMERLAADQPGYLGVTSVRDAATRIGVTVSYWATEADARAWRSVAEHREAQRLGRERWYAEYRLEVAEVGRAARFDAGPVLRPRGTPARHRGAGTVGRTALRALNAVVGRVAGR